MSTTPLKRSQSKKKNWNLQRLSLRSQKAANVYLHTSDNQAWKENSGSKKVRLWCNQIYRRSYLICLKNYLLQETKWIIHTIWGLKQICLNQVKEIKMIGDLYVVCLSKTIWSQTETGNNWKQRKHLDVLIFSLYVNNLAWKSQVYNHKMRPSNTKTKPLSKKTKKLTSG